MLKEFLGVVSVAAIGIVGVAPFLLPPSAAAASSEDLILPPKPRPIKPFNAPKPRPSAQTDARLPEIKGPTPVASLDFPPKPASETVSWSAGLITAAREQIGVTRSYDPAYRALSYPMGDVPRDQGVCTDVVIRALRDAHGIDLQERVHKDMLRAFPTYPALWGLKRPDKNIDHRRVPNLRHYFKRQGAALPISAAPQAFRPGDIVSWVLPDGQTHIGIVSDRFAPRTGTPMIIHNIGRGTREEDMLLKFRITGHYRLTPP